MGKCYYKKKENIFKINSLSHPNQMNQIGIKSNNYDPIYNATAKQDMGTHLIVLITS